MADTAVASPLYPKLPAQLESPRTTRGRRNDGASRRSRSPGRQRGGERERERERDPIQPTSSASRSATILGIGPTDRQEVPTTEEGGVYMDDKYYSSTGEEDEDIDMTEAPEGTFHADPDREAQLQDTAESREPPPARVKEINRFGLEYLKFHWGQGPALTEGDKSFLSMIQSQVVQECNDTMSKQLSEKQIEYKARSWAIPAVDIKSFGHALKLFFQGYGAEDGNYEAQNGFRHQLREMRGNFDRILDAHGIEECEVCPSEDLAHINSILNLDPNYQGTKGAPVASTIVNTTSGLLSAANALVSSAPSNAANVGPPSDADADVGPSYDVDPLVATDAALPDIHNNILGKREMIRRAGRGFRVIVNRGTEERPLYQVRPSSDWGTVSDFEQDDELQIEDPLDRKEIAALKRKGGKLMMRAFVQVRGNADSNRSPPTYILMVGEKGTPLEGERKWMTKTELFALKGSGKNIKDLIQGRIKDFNNKVAGYQELLSTKLHPDTKAPLTKADIQGEVGERLTWLLDGQDLPDLEPVRVDIVEPSPRRSRGKKKAPARVAQPGIDDPARTGRDTGEGE